MPPSLSSRRPGDIVLRFGRLPIAFPNRPYSGIRLAALTTLLGIPSLLKDAFFIPIAFTIIFGIGLVTVLTLIVVPVLYAIFFRVAEPA